MSAHRKGTGAVDKDRRSKRTKMDREVKHTDDRSAPDSDLRGLGRQAIAQQEREPDFDRIDRDLSAGH